MLLFLLGGGFCDSVHLVMQAWNCYEEWQAGVMDHDLAGCLFKHCGNLQWYLHCFQWQQDSENIVWKMQECEGVAIMITFWGFRKKHSGIVESCSLLWIYACSLLCIYAYGKENLNKLKLAFNFWRCYTPQTKEKSIATDIDIYMCCHYCRKSYH